MTTQRHDREFRRRRRPHVRRSIAAPAARSGSVILVLLVAAMLVAAATGDRGARPRQCRALYPGVPRGARHGRRVLAVRARLRHPAAADGGLRQPADQGAWSTAPFDGIVVTDRDGRVIYANAAYLDLIDASDAQRHAPGRARVHRRCRRVRGDLPAAQGGARRQAPAGGGAHRRDARPAGALAAASDPPARRAAGATAASRSGRSPTSPASASGRRMSFRNCSTRSTISITRRPASSRSMTRATSSISTPRSPIGSIRISPRSAPAASSSTDLVAGDGAALLTTLRAAPGEVKTEVLDLDLRTRNGRTLPVRLFHKLAFGADGTAGRLAHAGAQSRPRRRHRSAARRRNPLHAVLPPHADGDRDRRPRRRRGAHQSAVRAAVP